MFLVTSQQMDVFRREALQRFTREMVNHIRALFVEQVGYLPEEMLQQQVELCIQKALSHGISIEGDVQRYLECSVLLGWDLDVKPEAHWAGQILRDPGLPGEVKMDRIEQGLLSTAPRLWGP